VWFATVREMRLERYLTILRLDMSREDWLMVFAISILMVICLIGFMHSLVIDGYFSWGELINGLCN